MNYRTITLIALFIFTSMLSAEQILTIDNFAFRAKLSDSSNSLREVELPVSVLEGLERKDLGDLRVFNAQGQIVPHQISGIVNDESTEAAPLVFYPFNREQASDPAGIRIKILQNSLDQSIDIKSTRAHSHNTFEYQYIAENREKNKSVCELKLDWIQPNPSMILPLSIEGSNDLQNWTTLKHSAKVSKLNYAGSQLSHSNIKISCNKNSYLRLTWLKPEQGLSLKSITAIHKKSQHGARQKKKLGKPRANADGNWYFETRMSTPLTHLELIAPVNGLLYKARLYSRPNEDTQWFLSQTITQYRLRINDTLFASKAVQITPTYDKYWKLELETDATFSEDQLPDIQIGWQRQKLTWLAQGEAPYTLAYGNPDVKPARNNGLSKLIRTLHDAGETPDQVSLAQPSKNESVVTQKKNLPWKLIGLWLLLILGTGVLSYMAYQLYKQMND